MCDVPRVVTQAVHLTNFSVYAKMRVLLLIAQVKKQHKNALGKYVLQLLRALTTRISRQQMSQALKRNLSTRLCANMFGTKLPLLLPNNACGELVYYLPALFA